MICLRNLQEIMFKSQPLKNDNYSGGSCFSVTLLAESLRIFNELAVGETAAILSEAKVECGGGRNATAANSLKIPVTETRK